MESNQDTLKAAVVLNDKLDYNEQMIYHIILSATVSEYFFFRTPTLPHKLIP